MSRNRTRGQLVERTLRTSGTPGTRKPDARRFLAESYALAWYELCAGIEGFGVAVLEVTATPAQAIVNLPDEFLDLHSLIVKDSTGATFGISPTYTSRKELDQLRPVGTSNDAQYGRWYLLEGPGKEPDPNAPLGPYLNYPQRLEFFPPLGAANVVSISFITQEPDLGDPDDDADDALVIDVVTEQIERWIVAQGRIGLTTRVNDKERGRALQDLQAMVAAFANARTRRNQDGTASIDRYRTRRGSRR